MSICNILQRKEVAASCFTAFCSESRVTNNHLSLSFLKFVEDMHLAIQKSNDPYKGRAIIPGNPICKYLYTIFHFHKRSTIKQKIHAHI